MPLETSRDLAVPARLRVVWDALASQFPTLTAPGANPPAEPAPAFQQVDRPAALAVPQVLDCGGGSGSFAVPLARAGAVVTVVDISADALATLHRRADEFGVADRVHPVQGDVESLTAVVRAAGFDLVLAHGILEAVDSPSAAFTQIVAALRPHAWLSVLVGNPVAAVLARVVAGDVRGAAAELAAISDGRAAAIDVAALCAEHDLIVERTHGVGVFTELVPGSAIESAGSAQALAELEQAAAARAPFDQIAGRRHTLACRRD